MPIRKANEEGTRLSSTVARSERVLAIDPGTQVVGFACVERSIAGPAGRVANSATPVALRASNVVRSGRSGRSRVLIADALRLGRGASLASRLARLQEALEEWISEYQPRLVAIEEAFCGRSIQSALRIGEARGVVLGTAGRHRIEVREFAPARIKRAVTGSGRADKDQVATMVCQAFGIERPKAPADATDALAVALCCLEAERSIEAGLGGSSSR